MRLLNLRLQAYGHFTDTELEFQDASAAFHLVHGSNEAGKSTTLRAVRSLLYGVPQQSSDTFLHAGKDLRIGATLENERGEVLQFVRRKGRKNTLLDASGKALADDVLSPYLGGVDENLFVHMFGLDHESLRQGGQELLAGEGNLSESLFGAGSGTGRARELLKELRAKADQLFTSKGRGRKRINQEIAELREARPLVARYSTTASGYLEKQRELERATVALEELKRQRASLNAERHQLERLLRIRPVVAQRQALIEQRAQLGKVPDLPNDVAEWRLEAMRQIEDARQERSFLQTELARDEERLNALSVPESLAGLDPLLTDDLSNRLGQYKKAQADLPKREGELSAVLEEIRSLLRAMGQESESEAPDELGAKLLLSRSSEGRLRRLAEEKTRFDTAVAERSNQLNEAQASRTRWKKELARLTSVGDPLQLRHALSRAQKHLELENNVEQLRARQKKVQRDIERGFASLGLYQGELDALPRLPWPGELTLAKFERELEQHHNRLSRLTESRERLLTERAQLKQALVGIDAEGELPTLELLKQLRGKRDALLERLPDATSESLPSLSSELRSAVQDSDRCADTLRVEANRIAKKANLSASMGSLSEQLDNIELQKTELLQQQERVLGEWLALWKSLDVSPQSPREMRGWLARVGELVQLLAQRDEQQLELRRLEGRLAEVVKELSLVLEELGEPKRMLWESLTQLVERAQSVLGHMESQQTEQARLSRGLDEAELLAEESARRLAELKEQQKSWRVEWSKGLKSLGLPKDAGVEELRATLDGLSELAHKLDEARQLKRRISGMQRDAEELTQSVTVLVQEALPELMALPMEEAAEGLIRAHRKTLADAQSRQRVQADWEQHQSALRKVNQTEQRAKERLNELVRLAGASSVEELVSVEKTVKEAHQLEGRIQELEESVVIQGDGQSLATLVQAAQDLDSDEARTRLGEIASELLPLEEQAEHWVQERTTASNQLKELGAGAADAAEELAARRAKLQRSVAEYVRYRLAAVLLSREVERYREEHQGPVLSTANQLFPRLTLGRYVALRTGYDKKDEPILLCVRQDERAVSVEGLSDGTRDQLYLALRLASLQHYMGHHESMPLVLDDVLIHFDDERAKAALSVLGEFAERTQVLFFTHHARLRELACQAVPEHLLRLHELSE